jgi:hypothetical protein
MRRLLAAGILYLIVIAIILTIKPQFMFTDDGTWKEFGVGRNSNTHTWMPFWLFAILSALVSYIIIILVFFMFNLDADGEAAVPLPKSTRKTVIDEVVEVEPDDVELEIIKPKRRARAVPKEMEEGYYVLNRAATEAAGGVPKYIYIGKGLPTD